MMARDLIAEARTWIGVPFRHQGRSKETGVDCIGYFTTILRHAGILPKDFSDDACYGRAPNTSEFIDTVERYCTRIDKPEPGCLIAFKWPFAKFPSHVALMDDKGYMIHAYETKKKVIRHGYGQPWVRLTYGFYRLPGVTA